MFSVWMNVSKRLVSTSPLCTHTHTTRNELTRKGGNSFFIFVSYALAHNIDTMPKKKSGRRWSKTKLWRKLDVRTVEELSIQQTQETLRGEPLAQKKCEELFFEDKRIATARTIQIHIHMHIKPLLFPPKKCSYHLFSSLHFSNATEQ